MQAAIIRWAAMGLLILLVVGYGLWQRGSKEAAYRALDTAQDDARKLRSELAAEQERRDTEADLAKGQQQAGNDADQREREIQNEYDERLAAALAGRDSELDRLRHQCAATATAHLSSGAAASAEAVEQDRLRRASAARALRAAQLAQSERDEAVDLYQAVYDAQR